MFLCHEHVEINKFLRSLACTWMTIIESQFYIIALFHSNEMLTWWLPGCKNAEKNRPGSFRLIYLILFQPSEQYVIIRIGPSTETGPPNSYLKMWTPACVPISYTLSPRWTVTTWLHLNGTMSLLPGRKGCKLYLHGCYMYPPLCLVPYLKGIANSEDPNEMP